jgi:hypothetical protein
MWRRTYLLLILVRLYFALSPSYLHPDEHFQGPEVIAGMFQLEGGFSRSFGVSHPAVAAHGPFPEFTLALFQLY